MEAFAAAAPAAAVSATRPFVLLRLRRRRCRSATYRSGGATRPRLLRARASADGGDLPPLDRWDMMELDFGRYLGEDPKVTLAKILLKKSDPDASSLDVDKLIATKKDKLDDILREFMDAKKDMASKTPESGSPTISKPIEGSSPLNIARPVMGKPKQDGPPLTLHRPVGSKGKEDTPSLTLSRPAGSTPRAQVKLVPDIWPSKESLAAAAESRTTKVDITLRKPTVYQSEDDDLKSKLKMKPNIDLKMRKDMNEDLSNISLLQKPDVQEATANTDPNVDLKMRKDMNEDLSNISLLQKPDVPGATANTDPSIDQKMRKYMNEDLSNISLLQKPDVLEATANRDQDQGSAGSALISAGEDSYELDSEINGIDLKPLTERVHEASGLDDDSNEGLQPSSQFSIQENPADSQSASRNVFSMQAFLQGKPKREDLTVQMLPSQVDEKMNDTDENKSYVDDGGNLLPSKLEDMTEGDWTRLERYARTGEKVEVELINCSTKGFVVSLDSMIGFLPYRNLATKWKFLAFETWLRRKGGDPSLYKQNLGLEDDFEVQETSIVSESSSVSEVGGQDQGPLPSKPKFEDLLRTYNLEKSKFLSSFIGQRLRVSVVLADRNSRKIFFSMRPKESEESIQKKKSLMERLNVGDIVQCTIKRFVYFGIFVEVEGVPALIQQWEVSWDDTLDPSLSYKIGQVVDAKVIQLDYTNSRIFLSLKDVKPHPSAGALEAVIGEDTSLDGALEPVQEDLEWPEVDALIEEMQRIEGIRDVYKGRFFRSSGLAPTFQVYMAPVVGQKYKLLARYGNNVQEVMVETSLDKEGLKEAILTCTNRVS